jgi:hypothetical protein
MKWDTTIPEEDRARIRTEVAWEFFHDTYGRPPLDKRELSGFVAEQSRRTSRAVAGYDCTFSPVESISTLWAIAPSRIRDGIPAAHEAAVEGGDLGQPEPLTQSDHGGIRRTYRQILVGEHEFGRASVVLGGELHLRPPGRADNPPPQRPDQEPRCAGQPDAKP